MSGIADKIRDVPDFPKKGILFKDISTLLKDGEAFRLAVDALIEPVSSKSIDLIIGVEARGFIFAAAMAYKLGLGLIIARKPGKLPADKLREEYALEYGTDAIEMHTDAIQPGHKVLIVDDLLATGGTVGATINLVEKLGGEIVAINFLIELDFLNGREKLKGYPVHSIIHYDSE